MILNAPLLIMPQDKDSKASRDKSNSPSRYGQSITEEESKTYPKVKQVGVMSHKVNQKLNEGIKRQKEEECSYQSLSDDGDINEQFAELKQLQAIPKLKNTETLRRLESKPVSVGQQRLLTCGGDPYKVAILLTNDIKFISDQLFTLWFKLIGVITLNPKFIAEYLRIVYEEKMREYWGEHIYRTIVETEDFALPSEENVGEIHRQIAHQRRQSLVDEKAKNPSG